MVGFCVENFAASLSIWKDHGVNTINFPSRFIQRFFNIHSIAFGNSEAGACHKICMYVAGRPTFISLCAELLIGSATAFMSFLWPTFDEMFPPPTTKGTTRVQTKASHMEVSMYISTHQIEIS